MRQHDLHAAIAERIGPELATAAVDAIIANWGGGSQMIPNGSKTAIINRNQEIRRLTSDGIDHESIAKRFGLSVRHVQRIIGN